MDLDLRTDFGTMRWLIERYKRSRAWEKVSSRSRGDYERSFRLVLDYATKTGGQVAQLPVASITARAADKLYLGLQKGAQIQPRLRTANLAVTCCARAWDVVQRLYPKVVPEQNPFRGIELDHGKGTTRPATREEAYALHEALVAAGGLPLWRPCHSSASNGTSALRTSSPVIWPGQITDPPSDRTRFAFCTTRRENLCRCPCGRRGAAFS